MLKYGIRDQGWRFRKGLRYTHIHDNRALRSADNQQLKKASKTRPPIPTHCSTKEHSHSYSHSYPWNLSRRASQHSRCEHFSTPNYPSLLPSPSRIDNNNNNNMPIMIRKIKAREAMASSITFGNWKKTDSTGAAGGKQPRTRCTRCTSICRMRQRTRASGTSRYDRRSPKSQGEATRSRESHLRGRSTECSWSPWSLGHTGLLAITQCHTGAHTSGKCLTDSRRKQKFTWDSICDAPFEATEWTPVSGLNDLMDWISLLQVLQVAIQRAPYY